MTVSTNTHSTSRSQRRLQHLAAALLAGSAIFATVDAPLAQQATAISINVPGGNLSTALNALAAQAKLQIVYDAAITQGVRTSGVSGNLPVDAALSQMLSGTGISYRYSGRTVTLSKAATADAAAATDGDATNLDTLQVKTSRYYASGNPSSAAIDEELIARVQASSLPELVRQTPGVSMGGGVRLQGQSISIRGFARQSDTRILLDGAPKNFEKYDQGNIFVEPELLKRVEIEKGATSVRYGNGGFGGTVRMESKDAADMLRPGESWGAWGKTAYQTANKEFLETGALYGRSDFGTPITYDGLLSLTWRKGGDMRVGGGEHYAFSDSKLATGMAKFGAEFDGHEINTSVIYGESNNWGPVAAIRGQLDISLSDIARYGYKEAARRRLAWRELQDLTTTFEYKYKGDSELWNPRFMASYSSTGQLATRPGNLSPAASVGGLENEATYSDLRLELENTSEFTLGGLDHSLNYGLQYNAHKRDVWMYDVANKNSAQHNYGYYAPWFMPEGTQDTASAFVRDTISVTDDLKITPGMRFDFIRSEGVPSNAPRYNNPAAGHDFSAVDHTGFTPAISVIWDATRNLRLFADWSYAMRAPNIDEIYSNQSAATTAASTSRGLEAERNNTINLGAEVNFDDVLTSGDMFAAKVAVYNNHVTNPVTRRFGTANLSGMGVVGPVPFYWNTPSYSTSGLEIQAHYENERMFADLGLSWMTGTRQGAINNVFGPRTYTNDLAPFTAQTTLGVKFPDQDLTFGWSGTFVDAQDKTPYNQDGKTYARPPSAGYAVHGLFMSWTPKDGIMKDTELHAAVENIFDKNYEPYLADGITAMPGRNFKVSLSRKF
ncbi:TonB-dependent receptor [Neorhizobium sp. JUb45]|uniref:TonB-dependent receptor n=1 Tax=unclassified Neorhizobium TaxID=2629175 RepID=UPI001044DF2C|nr:TonB-dependent receptor [Neorhizobium sp. JUb45]TCR06888.1 hemoglobin/transferrin/lactoferrin receptor protein [Neorhizobium sp. JUb45]